MFKEAYKKLFIAIFVAFVLYIGLANFVWPINNPTANNIQYLFYLKEFFTFQKVKKFQGAINVDER